MTIANDNAAKKAPCPICRKPLSETYRPFCSKRCADHVATVPRHGTTTLLV